MTGATDGIGKEFAFQLAKNESNLIIIARNNDKLNQTKQEICIKLHNHFQLIHCSGKISNY